MNNLNLVSRGVILMIWTLLICVMPSCTIFWSWQQIQKRIPTLISLKCNLLPFSVRLGKLIFIDWHNWKYIMHSSLWQFYQEFKPMLEVLQYIVPTIVLVMNLWDLACKQKLYKLQYLDFLWHFTGLATT